MRSCEATRSACSASISTDVRDRLIPLDGPANFRDLGGYETREGRRVRSGRVFRSDSLSYMSDGDVAYVVEVLGLRTVIDLRAGHEVDEFSHGPLEAAGITSHHLPIVDETRPAPADDDALDPRYLTLDEIYLMMLARFGGRFATVLAVLADADCHPLVFYCAAGKDRTGLVAALVLGLLDVAPDVIAADYALTAERMPVIIERHRARQARFGDTAEVAHQAYGAHEAAMRRVLTELVAAHGSVERYVLEAGVEASAVASLRAALLE